MSDEKLRRLERRWGKTGSVEDEVLFLLERVRIGQITLFQLRLISKLEDPAAQAIIKDDRRDFDHIVWMTALSGLTRVALVRLALEHCVPHWNILAGFVYYTRAEYEQICSDVIDPVRTWLNNPSLRRNKRQVHLARRKLHQMRFHKNSLPGELEALCDLVLDAKKNRHYNAAKLFSSIWSLAFWKQEVEIAEYVSQCDSDPQLCSCEIIDWIRGSNDDNPLPLMVD